MPFLIWSFGWYRPSFGSGFLNRGSVNQEFDPRSADIGLFSAAAVFPPDDFKGQIFPLFLCINSRLAFCLNRRLSGHCADSFRRPRNYRPHEIGVPPEGFFAPHPPLRWSPLSDIPRLPRFSVLAVRSRNEDFVLVIARRRSNTLFPFQQVPFLCIRGLFSLPSFLFFGVFLSPGGPVLGG